MQNEIIGQWRDIVLNQAGGHERKSTTDKIIITASTDPTRNPQSKYCNHYNNEACHNCVKTRTYSQVTWAAGHYIGKDGKEQNMNKKISDCLQILWK